jgi:hypothetical protein
MRKNISHLLLIIGILFLINAIFGRYIVLPGYFESLEKGIANEGAIPTTVPVWKIIRYLIWAFSFKLGIFFITIGILLKTLIKNKILFSFILGGIIYILLAYAPIPINHSLPYGIGGVLMTIFIVLVLYFLSKERNKSESKEMVIDFRIIGYFFFAMATYNLCPLLGIKCFGLFPEKMIKYGLQSQANSFAIHILIELVIGWAFLFLSYYTDNIKSK